MKRITKILLVTGLLLGAGTALGIGSNSPWIWSSGGAKLLADRAVFGTGTTTTNNILMDKTVTGGTTAAGMVMTSEVQSDVTSNAIGYRSQLATQAASFTVGSLFHFLASQGTIGSGSAVTSQYGFRANNTLTGATNNYGFSSDIASGTGRWNFYASGTAANYFEGITTFNNLIIQTNPTTPANAAAACTVGTMAWDTGFIYICTATNTWKRVAIATW